MRAKLFPEQTLKENFCPCKLQRMGNQSSFKVIATTYSSYIYIVWIEKKNQKKKFNNVTYSLLDNAHD